MIYSKYYLIMKKILFKITLVTFCKKVIVKIESIGLVQHPFPLFGSQFLPKLYCMYNIIISDVDTCEGPYVRTVHRYELWIMNYEWVYVCIYVGMYVDDEKQDKTY